jgi:hypothetical protein
MLSAGGLILMVTLPKEERPEITLKLVYPSQPHIEVFNSSNVVAQAVTYSPIIWNIDHPEENSPLLLARPKIDYIPAHAGVGPDNLFQPVAGNLKQGTRLFGTISGECSLCSACLLGVCSLGRRRLVFGNSKKSCWHCRNFS